MEKKINSDYLRGHIDTIILKALASGEKYGYEICKDIETKSNGSFVLKQPSLYSALKRLETAGLINSYWQDSKIGGKRHYYTLTEKGIEQYNQSKEDWLYSSNVLDGLINTGKTDDEIKLNNEKLNEDIAESKTKIEEVKTFYEQYNTPLSNENNDAFLQRDFFDQKLESIQENTSELIDSEEKKVLNIQEDANIAISNEIRDNAEKTLSETDKESETQNKDYTAKNDAVFINETYMPDEKDASFMNNVYLKIKAPSKDAGGTMNYIASDAILPIDFYSATKQDNNKNKTQFQETKPLESYKIKPYSKYNSSISKTEFIKYSKIKLFQYLILFALMLIEISVCYYALKPLNAYSSATNKVFIVSVALSIAMLIVSISMFIFNPYKKKIVKCRGKYIYKTVLFCSALLFIYVVNVLAGVNNFLDYKYLSFWIVPAILSTNIIISEVVFSLLKKSKTFKA